MLHQFAQQHPAIAGFIVGYIAACGQCAAIGYLLVQRAKHRGGKPGLN